MQNIIIEDKTQIQNTKYKNLIYICIFTTKNKKECVGGNKKKICNYL